MMKLQPRLYHFDWDLINLQLYKVPQRIKAVKDQSANEVYDLWKNRWDKSNISVQSAQSARETASPLAARPPRADDERGASARIAAGYDRGEGGADARDGQVICTGVAFPPKFSIDKRPSIGGGSLESSRSAPRLEWTRLANQPCRIPNAPRATLPTDACFRLKYSHNGL